MANIGEPLSAPTLAGPRWHPSERESPEWQRTAARQFTQPIREVRGVLPQVIRGSDAEHHELITAIPRNVVVFFSYAIKQAISHFDEKRPPMS